MSLHCAPIFSSLELVDLDLPRVASDNEIAILVNHLLFPFDEITVLILVFEIILDRVLVEVMDTQDLIALVDAQVIVFAVVD